MPSGDLDQPIPTLPHQGNLAERIMHYNLHRGVDDGISGIIIPCQPPRGDYNALSFLLNFPDARCGCSLVAETAEQKYEKDGYAQNGHSSTASN